MEGRRSNIPHPVFWLLWVSLLLYNPWRFAKRASSLRPAAHDPPLILLAVQGRSPSSSANSLLAYLFEIFSFLPPPLSLSISLSQFCPPPKKCVVLELLSVLNTFSFEWSPFFSRFRMFAYCRYIDFSIDFILVSRDDHRARIPLKSLITRVSRVSKQVGS